METSTATRAGVTGQLGERGTLAVLAATAAALWLLLWRFAHTDLTPHTRVAQIAYFLAAFAVFCLAVTIVWRAGHDASRRTVWFLLAIGLAMRLTLAPVRPVTTSDMYRYVWEGRVVHGGFNPYADAPDSPRLAPLRDWLWTQVQYKEVPAAYPPVAQYVFALSDALPTDRIITLKLILALFDIGTVLLLPGLLVRLGRPPAWALIYAWHPLAVGELVARGHFDSIGIFFLVLALRLFTAASAAPRAWAGAALAASVLAKGYALFALPFFLLAARPRRGWFLLGLAVVAAVAYFPFASAGPALWRGLGIYSTRWYGYTAIFEVVTFLVARLSHDPMLTARRVCALAFAFWIVYLLWQQWVSQGDSNSLFTIPHSLFPALAGFYLLSPVLYPWYLAWTIPFLCLRKRPVWLLFTGTIYLYYAHPPGHTELPWVKMAEYGPPLVLALLLCLARKTPWLRRSALSSTSERPDYEDRDREPALPRAREHDPR